MTDVSTDVMAKVIDGLQRAFAPGQATPPLGGGADEAHLFSGDQPPYEYFVNRRSNCSGDNCCEPLLWARLSRWWYTSSFETQSRFDGLLGSSGNSECPTLLVQDMEIGIMRCAHIPELDSDYDKATEEALVEFDDSRRLRAAACWAMRQAENCGLIVQSLLSETVPKGPDGGLIVVEHSFSAVLKM